MAFADRFKNNYQDRFQDHYLGQISGSVGDGFAMYHYEDTTQRTVTAEVVHYTSPVMKAGADCSAKVWVNIPHRSVSISSGNTGGLYCRIETTTNGVDWVDRGRWTSAHWSTYNSYICCGMILVEGITEGDDFQFRVKLQDVFGSSGANINYEGYSYNNTTISGVCTGAWRSQYMVQMIPDSGSTTKLVNFDTQFTESTTSVSTFDGISTIELPNVTKTADTSIYAEVYIPCRITGEVNNVNGYMIEIEYSTDGGSTYPNSYALYPSTAGKNFSVGSGDTYLVYIPDLAATQIRFRVKVRSRSFGGVVSSLNSVGATTGQGGWMRHKIYEVDES